VNADVILSPGTPPDRLPDGDPPDVTELFRRHHLELVRLALLIVGDRPTAEDVVQDTCLPARLRTSRALGRRRGQ
jgi:DNA-directed RNA polymerase specialized sigma24 family protein